MAKLLAFLCCERAIMDNTPNRETLSLITILQGIRFGMPANVILPDKAMLGLRWSAVAVWAKEAGDPDSFQSKLSMLSPAGEELMPPAAGDTRFQGGPQARHIFHFDAIPVWRPGWCTVRLMYRISPQAEWTIALDYPFEIARLSAPPGSPMTPPTVH
jgi:hypothetical protein